MPDEDDGPKHGIDWRPTGGINLFVEGRKIRLRPPRLREYRKVTGRWSEIVEELESAAADAAEWGERMQVLQRERIARDEPAMSDDERREDRRRGKETREQAEGSCLAWWCFVVETLGDETDLLDPEDFPVFLTTHESVTQALGHWRSVPSLSGVR